MLVKKPRYEKITLPEFVARRRAGRPTAPRVIGYEEIGTGKARKIRTVKPGVMPGTWPALAYGRDTGREASQPPPKHARGFSERYLSMSISHG